MHHRAPPHSVNRPLAPGPRALARASTSPRPPSASLPSIHTEALPNIPLPAGLLEHRIETTAALVSILMGWAPRGPIRQSNSNSAMNSRRVSEHSVGDDTKRCTSTPERSEGISTSPRTKRRHFPRPNLPQNHPISTITFWRALTPLSAGRDRDFRLHRLARFTYSGRPLARRRGRRGADAVTW